MEQRKDYILNRWIYLAPERKKRPVEFKRIILAKEDKACYFCPGNENLTPPEIGRMGKGGKGKWQLRWFENKFPAVEVKGKYSIETDNRFFTFSDAYGRHEIIVESNEHNKQLWDFNERHLKDVLDIYKDRIEELSRLDHIKYVLVFKNHGREAGTSLAHSHTQVTALNVIPPLIQEEAEAVKGYTSCPYCDIISIEKGSFRACFENDSFAAFAPYASRFNYEIWVFPKRHVKRLSELEEKEVKDGAQIMQKILAKLQQLNSPYNYFIHYSPSNENLHLHIEICPRLAIWAGFEFGGNSFINSVTPEDAAKFYREEA